MTQITPEELDRIREEQATYLPQCGIIRRRQYVGDDYFDFTTIAEDVPSRLTPGFGFWRAVADRFQGMTPFRLTVPWDQDLQAGDVFVDEESRSYEVRDVVAPASYQTAKQALVDLVTDG